MRSRFPLKFELLLMLFLCVHCPNAKSQSKHEVKSAKIHALYLYNFTKNIKWPGQDTLKQFKIGLLGNDSLLKKRLIKVCRHKKFKGIPYKIESFSRIADIKPTQILYVDGDDGFDQKKVLNKVIKTSTLLVTENLKNLNLSMVNFVVIHKIEQFSINKYLCNQAGIKISPILFSLSIQDPKQWADTYSQFRYLVNNSGRKKVTINKKDLSSILNKYDSINAQISAKRALIDKQMQQIKEQQISIAKKEKEINHAAAEINEKKKELNTKKKELAVQQTKVNRQNSKLDSLSSQVNQLSIDIRDRQEILAAQKTEIDKEKANLGAQLTLLDQKKKRVDELDAEVGKQTVKLKTQLTQIKTQQLMLYLFIGVIFLVLIFFGFIYYAYRQKQKTNVIISKQKQEVENQKDIIEQKNKDITDNINYASRIQHALLASDAYISQHLKEYFVLFKPKDIVSGDFYWAFASGDLFNIACCDCTGHGVSGAFMSLLSIFMLNESVVGKQITRPDLIWNDVRKNIIKALNPDGKADVEGKDGMDAALCSFDFEKNMLYASCANNPVWIVRNNSDEITELKPDKMPIGLHYGEEKPFNLHSEQISKGDTIYIFSDGYVDQFGGEKGKKFKNKAMKQLLLSIQDKSMKEQHEILETNFHKWMGDFEQVDDVCVIGIKVS